MTPTEQTFAEMCDAAAIQLRLIAVYSGRHAMSVLYSRGCPDLVRSVADVVVALDATAFELRHGRPPTKSEALEQHAERSAAAKRTPL